MIFSEPLSQYEEILKDAIRTSMKESGAKLAKTPHIGRFWSGCAESDRSGVYKMFISLYRVARYCESKCTRRLSHTTDR